jgi:hypothetical protein
LFRRRFKVVGRTGLSTVEFTHFVDGCWGQVAVAATLFFHPSPLTNKLVKEVPRSLVLVSIQENGHLSDMIPRVVELVKVRQDNFGVIAFAMLHVLTRNRDFGLRKKPPVGIPLAVIQSWESTFSVQCLTVDITIVLDRNFVCESVSSNDKLILDILPVTGSIFEVHPKRRGKT